MIKITDKLWIGNSDDAYLKGGIEFGAVLNVARDLSGRVEHPQVEYAQVGLIDGPGNEIKDYCAAVLTLASLAKRHERVLIHDHDAGRAAVVVMIYLTLKTGHIRATPTSWSRWMTWEEVLQLVGPSVKKPRESHKEMFCKFPFGVVEVLL